MTVVPMVAQEPIARAPSSCSSKPLIRALPGNACPIRSRLYRLVEVCLMPTMFSLDSSRPAFSLLNSTPVNWGML